MSSRVGSLVAVPWWGASSPAGEGARARPARPRRGRGSYLLPAAALLGGWALLWSFFVAGVAGPAAALHRGGFAAAPAPRPAAGALVTACAAAPGERSTP